MVYVIMGVFSNEQSKCADMPATTKTGMNWQQRLADLYETNAMKIIHKKKTQYISSRSMHVCFAV